MEGTGHTGLISTATSWTPRRKSWIYLLPYHASASGKIQQYKGLFKAALRARDTRTYRHWDRGSAKRAGLAPSKLSHTVEVDKVPIVHTENCVVEGSLGCSCLGQGQTHPWDWICSRAPECL